MTALFQKLLVGLAIMMVATPVLALEATNTDMELLVEKVKADKKLLVGLNMPLTKEEAGNFWPLYEAYQKELQTVNQEIGGSLWNLPRRMRKAPFQTRRPSGLWKTSLLWKKRKCSSNGPTRIK